MKKLIYIALLSSQFVGQVYSQNITLPIISVPATLQEGTQRELSATQVAEIVPWANDSKSFLVDLLDATRGLPISQKIERLYEGVKQIVGVSNPKNSELFMRYILNRAISLSDLMTKEMDSNVAGTLDAKLRVLNLSIGMAITFHDIDMKNITEKKSSYAQFGIAYFGFLHELGKSLFDASAQYKIARTSLEWLQWDLYRDLNNTAHAGNIYKIYNALRIFPLNPGNDAAAINYIRQIKTVIKQLNLIKETPNNNQTPNSNSLRAKYGYFYQNETHNSAYYSGCYPISNSGSVMWTNRVSDSHCASSISNYYYQNETYNSAYSSGCYQKSTNGKVMFTSKVFDCGSKTYRYYNQNETYNSAYSSGCYQVSLNNKGMFSESKVSTDYCM